MIMFMLLLQHRFHLGDEPRLVRHIQHIAGGKELVGKSAQGVFGGDGVLLRAENDADGRIVVGVVDLGGVVVQAEVALPGTAMFCTASIHSSSA